MAPVDLPSDMVNRAGTETSRASSFDKSGSAKVSSASNHEIAEQPAWGETGREGRRIQDAAADRSSSLEKDDTEPNSEKKGTDDPIGIPLKKAREEDTVTAIAGKRKDYGNLNFEGLDPD
jgi:hypothetical protein